MLLSVGLSLLVKRFPALARYKPRLKAMLFPIVSLGLPAEAKRLLMRATGKR